MSEYATTERLSRLKGWICEMSAACAQLYPNNVGIEQRWYDLQAATDAFEKSISTPIPLTPSDGVTCEICGGVGKLAEAPPPPGSDKIWDQTPRFECWSCHGTGKYVIPRVSAPITPSDEMVEVGLAAAEAKVMELTFGNFKTKEQTFGNSFTAGFAERFRSIHRAALQAALAVPVAPITPSDEMVAAAQAAYQHDYEYGLNDYDMRACLTAALNLMGGNTK